MSLSLSLLEHRTDHLVVVTMLTLLLGRLSEVQINDLDELNVSLVEDLGCHHGHLRLVQQHPIGVLSFEDCEVGVEKCAI